MITERETYYHNGILKYEAFENGVLSWTGQIDGDPFFGNPGAMSWSSKKTFFDEEGTLFGKLINYDNGDELSKLYEMGELAARVTKDGDDSHSWYAKEELWDSETGAREVIFYDTEEDDPYHEPVEITYF